MEESCHLNKWGEGNWDYVNKLLRLVWIITALFCKQTDF